MELQKKIKTMSFVNAGIATPAETDAAGESARSAT